MIPHITPPQMKRNNAPLNLRAEHDNETKYEKSESTIGFCFWHKIETV